jgi:hypothetical protein
MTGVCVREQAGLRCRMLHDCNEHVLMQRVVHMRYV